MRWHPSLPFKHHEEREEESIDYSFDGWGGDLFHPRKHMQQLQSVRSHSPACEQLHQQRSAFKFLEILPISAHTHTHIDAWMHTMFPLWIRLFIRRCATSVIIQARCFSVCLSMTLTHHTGRMHVFVHGAASAYLQSPRIGRTLLASLGELTGRGGGPRPIQERIIKVGSVDVGWNRVCRTFVHQMRFYYVKQCSVIFN